MCISQAVGISGLAAWLGRHTCQSKAKLMLILLTQADDMMYSRRRMVSRRARASAKGTDLLVAHIDDAHRCLIPVLPGLGRTSCVGGSVHDWWRCMQADIHVHVPGQGFEDVDNDKGLLLDTLLQSIPAMLLLSRPFSIKRLSLQGAWEHGSHC